MKTTNSELQALAAVEFPRATALELETINFLKLQEINQEKMTLAVGKPAINAALALLKTDIEAVRAAHWVSLPLAFRRVSVMSANLQKDRADDTLNKFTALERGRINVSMQRLAQQVEILSKCMQGGEMPATAPAYH